LEECLNSFLGRYFTKEELKVALKPKFGNDQFAKKLSDLLTVFYADFNQFGRIGQVNSGIGNFLQVERKGDDFQYKVINTAFSRVKSQMIKLY
jgi:hypothetical protein